MMPATYFQCSKVHHIRAVGGALYAGALPPELIDMQAY